ncbi:MAG: dihydroxyacetone kinase subunit DhaK [Verrucomicrobiales bacterium]|nr:dihydroxyacetone kinase subunit DhaK [Verrucomicrobiales bacterium]
MSVQKKLINDPLKVADELVEGLIEAYNGEVRMVGTRSVVKNSIPDGKVALLVGGGSGHEPIYHGLVGRNLADGAACGDIFAAPPPNIVFEATEAVNKGNGVLYLYGNYAGDVMNFDIGAEMAEDEDIDVRTVLIADDVCSAPPTEKDKRRGIAGLVPIVKIVGAASQKAPNLDELEKVAKKAVLETRSVGVSMSPGSIPATGKPTFEIEADKIGLGMGIHGEPGVGEIPMSTADELTPQMLDMIIEDFEKDDDVEALKEGDDIVLIVNSLGATTMMELLICLRKAKDYFNSRGINIHDVVVGPLVTCQEMTGISFSVTRVDDVLKKFWNMPCQSLCYTKMTGRYGDLS